MKTQMSTVCNVRNFQGCSQIVFSVCIDPLLKRKLTLEQDKHGSLPTFTYAVKRNFPFSTLSGGKSLQYKTGVIERPNKGIYGKVEAQRTRVTNCFQHHKLRDSGRKQHHRGNTLGTFGRTNSPISSLSISHLKQSYRNLLVLNYLHLAFSWGDEKTCEKCRPETLKRVIIF
uniref:Uncharacterized protein n=1 Tax=Megaselia scalaris TaxID=36166 RepID=T1GTC9_MEGSC